LHVGGTERVSIARRAWERWVVAIGAQIFGGDAPEGV
jgi:hypothetical protein